MKPTLKNPKGWRNQTIHKWLQDNPGVILKVRDETVEGCHYLVRDGEYWWVTEDYKYCLGSEWVPEATPGFFRHLICDGIYKESLRNRTRRFLARGLRGWV